MAFKLSPSDFAFLWDECRRCFYLKVVRSFPRPSGPFPSIFNKIDKAMRLRFDGNILGEVVDGAPRGKCDTADRWIESKEFAGVFVKGKTDGVVTLEDGTLGVIDFKTSAVKPEYLEKYRRQLEAYAFGLEYAPGTRGERPAKQVTELGIIQFEPQDYGQVTGQKTGFSLYGPMTWVPMKRDRKGFEAFLKQVSDVLHLDEPPTAGEGCAWCEYKARAAREG